MPDQKKTENGPHEYPFIKITGVLKKIDERLNTQTGEIYHIHAINLPAEKPTDFPPRIAINANRPLGDLETEITVVARCSCYAYKTADPSDKTRKLQRYSHEFWHQPNLS